MHGLPDLKTLYSVKYIPVGRSQWPWGLRLESATAHMMRLRVRIIPGPWGCVFCDCCVLSVRDLCVGLITHPEKSCGLWCVGVWSWSLDNDDALAHWGLLWHGKKWSNGESSQTDSNICYKQMHNIFVKPESTRFWRTTLNYCELVIRKEKFIFWII